MRWVHDGGRSRPAPQLNPDELEIVNSYGGWTQFCDSLNLKPWDAEQNEKAANIVRLMAFNSDDLDNNYAAGAGGNQSD